MRKNLLIVSILISLAVLIYVAFPAPKKEVSVSTPPPVLKEKTYPIPPQIQPLITQLGIDQSTAQKLEYHISATNPCGGTTWGCYQLKQIWINEPVPYKLAHEYLHYIYFTTPEVRSLNLRPLYDNNPLLRQGMRNYTPEEIEKELFPVICTQVADYKLPPEILQACTKYLPNRNILPSDY